MFHPLYMPRAAFRVLTVCGLTCLACYSSTAEAHHILGIPHYKYSEEYPQIPFVEIMAQTGPHDLHFTYFPGTPQPGEAIRFKLYAKNRASGEPFREPLAIEVRKTRFLAQSTLISEKEIRTGIGPEANDYKFFLTFEEAEAYEVHLKFPNGEGLENIPFPVTIGKTDDRPLFFGAAALLLLSIFVVAVVKRVRPPSSHRQKPRGAFA